VRSLKYPRILRVAELIRATEQDVRDAATTMPRGVTMALADLPAGVLVTLELRRAWWDHRPRGRVLRELQRAMDRVRARERQVVVAAAILSGNRVLAAKRSYPANLAGRWEFPGGKVEKGESLQQALVRECLEELGVVVTVGEEVGRQPLADAELVLFLAALSRPGAEPEALDHAELRWLDRADITQVDWLPANAEFVADVTRRL
jgi:8-oxo-dGTP diphosphatase